MFVCVFACEAASVMTKSVVSHRLGDWTRGEHTHTHHKVYLQERAPPTARLRPECYFLQSGAVNGLISQLVVYKCSVVWFQSSVSVDVGLRGQSVGTNVEH